MEKNLYLPKTSLPLNWQKEKVTLQAKNWTGDLYHRVNQSLSENGKSPFFLLSGPPYANGEAHLGHVLNQVLKDLVVKSKWLQEQPVFYQPAWDCFGLPLELLAEKTYGKMEDVKQKKAKCKHLVLKGVAKQKKTFKELGMLADWQNPLLTLSEEASQATYQTLLKLVEKDLLSYEDYPVHMCPVCQSSLAEAELESKEALQKTLYFTFTLEEGEKPLKALVWTSTPWTVLMNQALAFNQDLKYVLLENTKEKLVLLHDFYVKNKNLFHEYSLKGDWFPKGTQALNFNCWVPMETASFVENKGTGFVHVVAAHGKDDFLFCQKLNLPVLTWVENNGKFNNSPYEFLNGKKLSEVTDSVVTYLKERNMLFSLEDKMMTKDLCWRHKSACFVKTSKQLFLNLPNLPKLEDTEFNQKLLGMMKGRDKWCLSRQRVWGNKLLLWHKNGQLHPANAEYLHVLVRQDTKKLELLQQKLQAEGYEQLQDVFDVWWDSGNLSNLYTNLSLPVPDLVVEGKDQFRGWFQSLTWLSLAANNAPAFKKGLVHGFVLNKDKEKFSKSKGNAPNLKQYLDKFGPDVLRLWVAGSSYEDDVVFSEEKLKEMEVFYKRFRGTLRYLLSNMSTMSVEQVELGQLEVKVLQELENCTNKVFKYLENYNFHHALVCLYEFCDKELSNFYFEYAKPVLYLNSPDELVKQKTLKTFKVLFFKLLKLLSVFVPYLTDEVYTTYQKEVLQLEKPRSVFFLKTEAFNSNVPVHYSSEHWQGFQDLKESFSQALEKMTKEKKCSNKLELSVNTSCSEQVGKLLKQLSKEGVKLRQLFGVSEFNYVVDHTPMLHLTNLKDKGYVKCARCWEYKETEKCSCL